MALLFSVLNITIKPSFSYALMKHKKKSSIYVIGTRRKQD